MAHRAAAFAPSRPGYRERRLHVVTYDRPGYGVSTRQPHRAVADAAADVAAIADSVGWSRFAVAGVSGGAPHALAVAALLNHRVTRWASIVGAAPINAEGLDYVDDSACLSRDWGFSLSDIRAPVQLMFAREAR